MAFIRKFEYDSDKEYIICNSACALYNHKACKHVFKTLYPKSEYVYYRKNSYNLSNLYLAEQDIFILDEEHIKSVNELGLDCFHTCSFAIIKKESVFYIRNIINDKCRFIDFNKERYVINMLIQNGTITHDQYVELCKNTPIYTNNTVTYVKTRDDEDDYM